jgi:adenylate cyclase
MDWDAAGLLDDLDDDARAARVRLLDALHADGATTEELRAAVAEDRLVLLPIERALGTPAAYTLAELVARSRLSAEQVERRLRALGVTVPEDPEARAFSEDDLEAVDRGRTYIDVGMDPVHSRAVVHLMSGLMERTADAVSRLFAETFLEPGVQEDDLGRRYGEMAAALNPLVAADLDYLLRLHLRDHARSDALGMTERASGQLPNAFDVAVAFTDIVGFTALGEELPGEELTDIAERLELLAGEQVRPPVRVVKTIGDAVMVVSRDPDALVDAMVAIVAAAEGDLPALRTGIAYGRAVLRLGDWFGPAVNLASRVTSRARPGAVLVSDALVEALRRPEAYTLSEAGRKRLKGISEPVAVKRLRAAASS